MYIIQVMSWTLFEQWLDDHVVSCSRTVIGTNHEMDVAVSQLTGLGMPVKRVTVSKTSKIVYLNENEMTELYKEMKHLIPSVELV